MDACNARRYIPIISSKMAYIINHPIPTEFAFEPTDDTTLRAVEYYLIKKYPDVTFEVQWHEPGVRTPQSVWYMDLIFENEQDAMLFALKYQVPLDIEKWINDL